MPVIVGYLWVVELKENLSFLNFGEVYFNFYSEHIFEFSLNFF